MNKKIIVDLLEDQILKDQLDPDLKISKITTKLNGSDKNALVFYNLQEGHNSFDKFKRYYRQSSQPSLIIAGLCEDPFFDEISYVRISSTKIVEIQKKFCDLHYPLERKKVKLIGVTGTDGKTSTVLLSAQISLLRGKPALAIGTLGVTDPYGVIFEEFAQTTPSYIDLSRIIFEYSKKYSVFFIEVSSHALKSNRLYDVSFDSAGWTNFSQDHLDHHGTMDDYFRSKLSIIDQHLKRDKELIVPSREKDLRESLSKRKVRFKVSRSIQVKSTDLHLSLRTRFNLNNLELALSLNDDLHTEPFAIDVSALRSPPGRFNIIHYNKQTIIIDFAHTANALKKIALAIMDYFPNKSRTIVFGCGGDRDRTKRAPMGKVASTFFDNCYVTSDNPRSEEPLAIISEIYEGVLEGKKEIVRIQEDRTRAIEEAIHDLEVDGVLLIAGKGHETYQEVHGTKISYNDLLCVQNYFNDRQKKIP